MEQLSLFAQEIEQNAPLASRLRPENLDDYIGQEHLVGKGKILRQMLDTDRITSQDQGGFHRFQRCHKRNQRDQGRDEAGGGRQAIGP